MFDVRFYGRVLGAIGEFYTIHAKTKNNPEVDQEACLLELYEKYEHIWPCTLQLVKKERANQ